MSRGMPADQNIVYIDSPRLGSSTNAGRFLDGVYGSERQRWQMACSTTTTTTAYYSVSRHRNLSGPCTGNPRPNLDNRMLATPPPGVPASRCDRGEKENHYHSKDNWRHHRKLDRSLSDSEDRINGNNGRGVNSSRYKTELCRPFEENGHCKYGDKCQFAHGQKELRNVTRHPKYKTELCRTYHSIGFCPYGPRCHFIHEDNLLPHQRKGYYRGKPGPFILNPSALSSSSLSSNSSTSTLLAHRPSNLGGLNSLGSSFESVSSSSTPGNLSPSHVDDQFPPIGTFSPSEVSETLAAALCPGHHQDSERSVFNFPASDAASSGSIMTPLNIQTQQMYNNMLDMAALTRFSAVMNISQNNQHNNQSSAANLNNVRKGRQQEMYDLESWPLCAEQGMAIPPLSHSPISLSDDSMGSNGSLEMTALGSRNVDNAEHMINSPHDVSRSMRLPIFHKFSGDSES